MKGRIPFDCTLHMKRKSLHKENPFNFDLYNDHLFKNRRIKGKERCFWTLGSILKLNAVGIGHQTKTSIMTPTHCATMPPVTIPKEPTTPQSATSPKQDLATDAKCEEQTVFPWLLSANKKVSLSYQPTERDIYSESKKLCSSVNPSSTSDLEKSKEISKTALNGKKFPLTDDDSLLYEAYVDEEMSSELDSSMEGRLLIDESMSDEEEVGNNEVKENMAKDKVHSIPPTNKLSLSPILHKDLNTSTLKDTNSASETEQKLCCQKLLKNLDEPENDSLSNRGNEKACIAMGTDEKEKVNKSDLENTESQIGTENLSAIDTVQDTPSTNSKISDPPPKFFLNGDDDDEESELKADNLKTNTQSSYLDNKNSKKLFDQNDGAIFKEAINTPCNNILSLKMAPNNNDAKDKTSEQVSKPKSLPEIIKSSATVSCSSSVKSQKFLNESDKKKSGLKKDELKPNAQLSKDAVNNLCNSYLSPKMAPNKNDSKDKTTEPSSKIKYPTEISKNTDTISSGTQVQPSSSESKKSSSEELSIKLPCQKVSFIFLNDHFICLSCSKRFTNESVFMKHAWYHFHRRTSNKLLCTHCSSNKDISQCPTVKMVSTTLHNACNKVASLPLDLSLASLPKNKKETINLTVSAENPLIKNLNTLPRLMSTRCKTLENANLALLNHSENLEYITVFISSQQFMCMKCYERIVPSKLAQHIYRHLHELPNLYKHCSCISAKECCIMEKITPVIPSLELRKSGFFIWDISWKQTIQRDLKFKILLIRHNSNGGLSRNFFFTSREGLQVVKSSMFLIPNQTKRNSLSAENNANIKDMAVEVIGYNQEKDNNVIILDNYPDVKETLHLANMKQKYKKMTFVIRCGHYMCSSCIKIYFSFNMLMAHIMWHFHSHKKLCSKSHYDGHLSRVKECPILSNITRCVPKLDKEVKMVNVYWKKNVEEKTSFVVQIVNLKKNTVIDLTETSDDEDGTKLKQSLKEKTASNIDKNSLNALLEYTSCLESDRIQKMECKKLERKPSDETKIQLKSDQEKVPEFNSRDNSLETSFNLASQFSENSKAEDVKNSSQSDGGFYICGFSTCKFSCIESDQFQEHLKKFHSHEKMFPCIHCGHQSYNQDLLMKHMDTHTCYTLFLLYHCSVCEYATNLFTDFKHHLWSNHSETGRYICRYCKHCFSSITLLLEHLSKNLLKFILCPHCSARDIYRRRMLSHIRTKHPDKPRKIIVTSQIICKIINQNKLKGTSQEDEEKTVKKSKNKGNFLIVIDDEEEEEDASKPNHVEDKENLIAITNQIPETDKEIKRVDSSPHLSLLSSLLSSVKTKPILDHCLANDTPSDVETKSKNEKHSSKLIKEKKSNDVIIIEDNDESDTKNDDACSTEGEVIQKETIKSLMPIITGLLSNKEGKRASTNETKVPKSKSGVEEEKKNKVINEHYTVKDSSKLPCELKIMLRRTSSTKEMGNGKNMSSYEVSDKEGKTGKAKNADVQNPSSSEALIPSSKSQNAVSKNCSTLNSLFEDDSVNNEVENNLTNQNINSSLLQDVSLSGATLDLRLQKCYTKSTLQTQNKNLVCSICLKVYKVLYQMHLHLLSDHFKWPLWECQQCGLRVYSHSKITTHCWRVHKNLSPQIKSLELPVIVLDENNQYVVANVQERFVKEKKIPPSLTSSKKGSKSMPSKSKKDKPSAALDTTSEESPKHSRKRSKSTVLDKKVNKKNRSSVSKTSTETTDLGSTSSVSNSAPGEASVVAASAAIVKSNRHSISDSEQPPPKKPKISNLNKDKKKCSMCGLSYSSKSNLNILQHVIQEHMKEYQNLISDEEIEQIEEAITGSPSLGFVCPFCNHLAKQRVDCKIHVWRTHAGLKLLDCSQCKFVTWFKHHMKRHMAECHMNIKESFSKDNETLLFSVANSNCNVVSSTHNSHIQQDHGTKTSELVKSKYATLFEQNMSNHHSDHCQKEIVNGLNKNETLSIRKKSLKSKISTKSSSHLEKTKCSNKPKSLNADIHSKIPTKSKNAKTPSTSLPHQKASTSLPHQKASTSLPHQKASTSLPHQKASTSLPHQKASTSLPLQKASTSVPFRKTPNSNKGTRKDKTPSKSSDKSKSSKNCEKKDCDRDKNSKENKAERKSSQHHKQDTVLKNILPKPPFLSEKSSTSKSLKNNKTPKTSTAEQKVKVKSTNLYTNFNCAKTGKKLYSCTICSVIKDSLSGILSHSKKHQEVQYECSLCAYRKHNRSRVFQHMQLEHHNEGCVLSIYENNQKKSKSEEKKEK